MNNKNFQFTSILILRTEILLHSGTPFLDQLIVAITLINLFILGVVSNDVLTTKFIDGIFQGWVVLSDKLGSIEMARTLATQVRWEARVIDVQNGSDQRLLVCQKPFLKK